METVQYRVWEKMENSFPCLFSHVSKRQKIKKGLVEKLTVAFKYTGSSLGLIRIREIECSTNLGGTSEIIEFGSKETQTFRKSKHQTENRRSKKAGQVVLEQNRNRTMVF